MRMKKLISLFASCAMIASVFSSMGIIASADASVGVNENPVASVKVATVTSAGKAAIDLYFNIDAEDLAAQSVVTDDETLEDKVYGKGIRTIQVTYTLNPEYFDINTAASSASGAYKSVAPTVKSDKSVDWTYLATSEAGWIVENNIKLCRITVNVKNNLSAAELNAKTDLVNYKAFTVKVEGYPLEGATAAGEKYYETSTYYRLDGNGDYIPKTIAGAEGVTPVAPVVTGVAVTPAAAEVAGGATQTFTVEVTGTAGNDAEGNPVAVPQDVVWEASAGSITADGVFTAPAATAEEQTITVTATAKDTEISGTATVTVPAKVVVPEVTVTIVPAKKTTNEAWLAAKGTTMFWGVKVSGDAAAASAVLTDTDDTATTATLPVDLSAIEGSGDKEFGVYVVLSEGRLGHAIELAVTAGDGADTDTATYNNL